MKKKFSEKPVRRAALASGADCYGRLANTSALSEAPAWLLGLVLFLMTVALYFRTTGFDFIALDDPAYVSENTNVLKGLTWDGVRWAFDLDGPLYFHPLTWLSLMLDVSVHGMDPGGFHVTNYLLHTGNVILLFLLVFRLVGNRWVALAVAAAFSVHPMHVESVAWVAERKDVLSTLFGLAVMHAYVSWVRQRLRKWLLLALGLHAVGLMAKPMLVTMPGLLLLLDLWPLGRAGAPGAWPQPRAVVALMVEKWPFLLLGVLCTVLVISSHPDALSVYQPSMPLRVANALASYVNYAGLLIFPHGLGLLYAFPDSIPAWQTAMHLAVLAVISVVCVRQWALRPYLLIGWLWFLISLVPVIIPPKVGTTAAMADRFAYVAYWGLYVAGAMLAAEMLAALRRRTVSSKALLALCLVPFVFWAAVAWRQLDYWKDQRAAYERSLAVAGRNYYVLNSYGVILFRAGEYNKAERLLREAIEKFPDAPLALANLGHVQIAQMRYAEAIEFFQRALLRDLAPGGLAHEDYSHIGLCLAQLGRMGEAEDNYRKALELKPDYAMPYNDLGNIALARGEVLKARDLYEKAAQLDPTFEAAQVNLSRVRARLAAGG